MAEIRTVSIVNVYDCYMETVVCSLQNRSLAVRGISCRMPRHLRKSNRTSAATPKRCCFGLNCGVTHAGGILKDISTRAAVEHPGPDILG